MTCEKVTRFLVDKKFSISFMESCTSGLLASMFTDTEGASSVFTGSLVTYSNEMKVRAGVDEKIIEEYGVYSPECARAMAKTVQKIYRSDIAIGITGTTGNIDPNNPDSIQGEVFFCIFIGGKFYDYHLKKDVKSISRKEIKQIYADSVYENLWNLLVGVLY